MSHMWRLASACPKFQCADIDTPSLKVTFASLWTLSTFVTLADIPR